MMDIRRPDRRAERTCLRETMGHPQVLPMCPNSFQGLPTSLFGLAIGCNGILGRVPGQAFGVPVCCNKSSQNWQHSHKTRHVANGILATQFWTPTTLQMGRAILAPTSENFRMPALASLQ